jgi:hypothetical protein
MKNQTLKNIIKESITDYLAELNTDPNVPEDSTDMALDMIKNGLPTQTKEVLGTSAPGLMFEDKVTKDKYVYLVKEAMNESTEKNLVEKKLLLDLIGEGYKGAYLNEATAMKAAKTAIKERETLMKENVKKGQAKVGGLEKQVANLKAEMAKLIDNPEMRGELSNYTAKLEKAEQVLEKLKAALEKSSPKKEKKEKKDDLKEFSPYGSIAFVGNDKPKKIELKDGETYLKNLKVGNKFSIGKLEYIVVKPSTGKGVEVKYADGTGNMNFREDTVVKKQ